MYMSHTPQDDQQEALFLALCPEAEVIQVHHRRLENTSPEMTSRLSPPAALASCHGGTHSCCIKASFWTYTNRT